MLATNSTSQKAAISMITKPRKSEANTMGDTKSIGSYSNADTNNHINNSYNG
jgi:hypothetical protein